MARSALSSSVVFKEMKGRGWNVREPLQDTWLCSDGAFRGWWASGL